MKKFLCICLTLSIVFQGFVVFASGNTMTCNWENDKITVTAEDGTFTSNAQVDMIVLQKGKTLANLSDTDAIVCTATTKAGRLGGVKVTEPMKVHEDGEYPVYLIPSGDDATVKGTVFCSISGVGKVRITSANKSDDAISVTVEVSGTEEAQLYLAVYDSNGCLVAIEMKDATSGTYTLNGKNAAKAKAMLWEKGNTYKPLSAADESPL